MDDAIWPSLLEGLPRRRLDRGGEPPWNRTADEISRV